jgi:hypothetical protein
MNTNSGNYVRTDEEKAHQAEYERKEAAKHGRVEQVVVQQPVDTAPVITYTVEESVPNDGPTPVTRKIIWHLKRAVTKSSRDGETKMGPYYRKVEALQAEDENVWRDEAAAARIGTAIRIVRAAR